MQKELVGNDKLIVGAILVNARGKTYIHNMIFNFTGSFLGINSWYSRWFIFKYWTNIVSSSSQFAINIS